VDREQVEGEYYQVLVELEVLVVLEQGIILVVLVVLVVEGAGFLSLGF
jgi:hypothetical protein